MNLIRGRDKDITIEQKLKPNNQAKVKCRPNCAKASEMK